jgi:hypothetical protein
LLQFFLKKKKLNKNLGWTMGGLWEAEKFTSWRIPVFSWFQELNQTRLSWFAALLVQNQSGHWEMFFHRERCMKATQIKGTLQFKVQRQRNVKNNENPTQRGWPAKGGGQP